MRRLMNTLMRNGGATTATHERDTQGGPPAPREPDPGGTAREPCPDDWFLEPHENPEGQQNK